MNAFCWFLLCLLIKMFVFLAVSVIRRRVGSALLGWG